MTCMREILPIRRHNGTMLRNVAVVVLDGFEPFELGVVCEVFGTDRTADGLPGYDFAVVAGEPGPLRSAMGFTLDTPFGLERLEEADLVAVPAITDGQAGLQDGRRCTTHWRNVSELALCCPGADVDPSVLYVDDDPVITSAGTAAGIDACLYLVRKEQGSKVANAIARRMVVPPQRDGGQAQYIDRPLPAAPADSLATVIRWMEGHLDQQVTVAQLASRAHMSPRSFARRFVQETGTTPQRWLTGQRILLAQHLLEETGETVDAVAERAGFGNATALRHHFRAWRHTTPHAYRRAFRPAAGGHAP